MIIYFLMVAYVFIIGVISRQLVTNGSVVSKQNNYTNLFLAIMIFALPLLFIGLRDYIADTTAYINTYNTMKADFPVLEGTIFQTKGYGWKVYIYLLKYFFHLDATGYLFVTAVLQAVALIKFYYKFSPDYNLSVLLFFLSVTFFQMMNGIRQFFAVCLILFFAEWIFNKKYIRFLLVVFVAISIHNATIIWVASVFLIQGKPANKRMFIFSIIVILSIAFVDRFTNILEDTLTETVYSGYTKQFSSDNGSNFMHTLIAAVPLVIAIMGRDKVSETDDRITNSLINISLIETMISLLANFTSGILIGRMPACFSVFSYALLPRLFPFLGEKNAKTIQTLCILGYFMYFVYYMVHTKQPYHSRILGLDL